MHARNDWMGRAGRGCLYSIRSTARTASGTTALTRFEATVAATGPASTTSGRASSPQTLAGMFASRDFMLLDTEARRRKFLHSPVHRRTGISLVSAGIGGIVAPFFRSAGDTSCLQRTALTAVGVSSSNL